MGNGTGNSSFVMAPNYYANVKCFDSSNYFAMSHSNNISAEKFARPTSVFKKGEANLVSNSDHTMKLALAP